MVTSRPEKHVCRNSDVRWFGDYKKPFGLQGIGLLLCAAVSWPTVSVGDQHCIRSVTFLLANKPDMHLLKREKKMPVLANIKWHS